LAGNGFNDGLKRNDTAFCFGSSLNNRVVAGTIVVCLQPVEEALRTLETGKTGEAWFVINARCGMA
jgi:hypothetical protein